MESIEKTGGRDIGAPANKVSQSGKKNRCINLHENWGNVCLGMHDPKGNCLRCVDVMTEHHCPKNRRVSPIIDADIQNAYLAGRWRV